MAGTIDIIMMIIFICVLFQSIKYLSYKSIELQVSMHHPIKKYLITKCKIKAQVDRSKKPIKRKMISIHLAFLHISEEKKWHFKELDK